MPASPSIGTSLVRWLRLKNYQYEVTFSLYMLTRTEKIIFNTIILVLFSLLVIAASLYLPDHVIIIANRIWYYIVGEYMASPPSGSIVQTTAALAKETVGAVAGAHSEL